MMDICLEINTELFIPCESTIYDIGAQLQKCTSWHLYIEDCKLKGVKDTHDVLIGRCKLKNIKGGYFVEENITGKEFCIFSKELMSFLTSEPKTYLPLSSYYDVTSGEFEVPFPSSPLFMSDEETESISDTEDEDYEDYKYPLFIEEQIEIPEYRGGDSSEEMKRMNMKDFEESIKRIYAIVDSDEPQESLENSEELQESLENSGEPLENSGEPLENSGESLENSEEPQESRESQEFNQESLNNKAYFRIFMRDNSDIEMQERMPLNKKSFKIMEDENSIDLSRTITFSFTTFLEKEGYNSEVGIIFYDDIYAEVEVITKEELKPETIQTIENEAYLNLDYNDILFFRLRYIENNRSRISNNMLYDNNVLKLDQVYDYEVPISRIPHNITHNIPYLVSRIPLKGDEYVFTYKGAEFMIKNEGQGFYSIFDPLDSLGLPHLDPSLYYNSYEYNELPVAQFYFP